MKTEARMLSEKDLPSVLTTMVAGFSDYMIPIEIDESGYKHKFALDGVDLGHSVGGWVDGDLVGLTMNGVGDWAGRRTAYDAGTVVLSDYRSKGVSSAMFDLLLPSLADMGIESYLLEVIDENEPAVRLYRKFGFRTLRELGVFYKKNVYDNLPVPRNIALESIKYRDIAHSELLSDQGLAWQNSKEWLERSEAINYGLKYKGLFVDNEIKGFGIVSPRSGKVLRVVVDPGHLRKGFGRLLVNEIQKDTKKDLIFLNVDLGDSLAVSFLEACGAICKIKQFEMEKSLS